MEVELHQENGKWVYDNIIQDLETLFPITENKKNLKLLILEEELPDSYEFWNMCSDGINYLYLDDVDKNKWAFFKAPLCWEFYNSYYIYIKEI